MTKTKTYYHRKINPSVSSSSKLIIILNYKIFYLNFFYKFKYMKRMKSIE